MPGGAFGFLAEPLAAALRQGLLSFSLVTASVGGGASCSGARVVRGRRLECGDREGGPFSRGMGFHSVQRHLNRKVCRRSSNPAKERSDRTRTSFLEQLDAVPRSRGVRNCCKTAPREEIRC